MPWTQVHFQTIKPVCFLRQFTATSLVDPRVPPRFSRHFVWKIRWKKEIINSQQQAKADPLNPFFFPRTKGTHLTDTNHFCAASFSTFVRINHNYLYRIWKYDQKDKTKPRNKNQQNIYNFFDGLHAFKPTEAGKKKTERKKRREKEKKSPQTECKYILLHCSL